MMTKQARDHPSKAFHELSALVLSIILSPATHPGTGRRSITPAGFASMLLGISLSLMLCGSVTFFIGFVLMPWVLGLVIFVYLVSSISMIGKTMFCCNSAVPAPAPASWKLL